MVDLPNDPFTLLTVERTDADSPMDEVLVQDIAINTHHNKAHVTSLEADVTSLYAEVTTLTNNINAVGFGSVLLGYIGIGMHSSED